MHRILSKRWHSLARAFDRFAEAVPEVKSKAAKEIVEMRPGGNMSAEAYNKIEAFATKAANQHRKDFPNDHRDSEALKEIVVDAIMDMVSKGTILKNFAANLKEGLSEEQAVGKAWAYIFMAKKRLLSGGAETKQKSLNEKVDDDGKGVEKQDLIEDKSKEGGNASLVPPEAVGKIVALVNELHGILSAVPSVKALKDEKFDTYEYFLDLAGVSKSEWEGAVKEVNASNDKCDLKHRENCTKASDIVSQKILPHMKFLIDQGEKGEGDKKSKSKKSENVGARDVHFIKKWYNGHENLQNILDAYDITRLTGGIRALEYQVREGKVKPDVAKGKIEVLKKRIEELKSNTEAMEAARNARTAWSYMQKEMKEAASKFKQIQEKMKSIKAFIQRIHMMRYASLFGLSKRLLKF